MIPKDILISKLREFIDGKLNIMANNNLPMRLAKPLLKRTLDKFEFKADTWLEFITDKDGKIDIDGIVSETIENLTSEQPQEYSLGNIGKVELGGGCVKIELPILHNKRIIFNKEDFIDLKNILTK